MKNTDIQERVLQPAHGIPALILELVLIAVSIVLMVGGVILLSWSPLFGVLAIIVGPILLIADCICFAGLKTVRPNEALVLKMCIRDRACSPASWRRPTLSRRSPAPPRP